MNDSLLIYFQSQWKFARSLTRDLLRSLSEVELHASPGGNLGSWWKQFRHMGRVQENYLDALESGTASFGIQSATYTGGASAREIETYFQRLDRRLQSLIDHGFPHATVDWFGESKSVPQHLLCMLDHEILHHGQWIVYRKLLGGPFPESWSIWGL